ncbi:MAG: NfeD family protein [Anaerolinea sp.]|nr:NfeD family protein [Anaerolinea sp.]
MLHEFWASGTLNIVYAGVVFTSFVFAVITLVGAEFGDALDFGADADGGVDFISVSPFALAMFGAGFGTAGLVTRLWLDMGTIPSVLWATAVGLVFGVLAQAFFIYILSPSKSSHFSLSDDAAGREVEVITTIPANGMGEIAYDNVSGRVKLGARSATGKPIKRGSLVTIERVTGRVAVVRPFEES